MRQLLDRLNRRVNNMVARAVVWMATNTTMLQELQVSLQSKEVRNVERFQQYGFTSYPLPEAEAVLLFLGGLRDHAIAIAVDDRRYRPTTQEAGEVCLYHHEGDQIRLLNGRIVQIISNNRIEVIAPEVLVSAQTVRIVAAEKVRMETPLLEVTGEIKDRCDSDGKTMEQQRTVYDAHVHGASPGPTPTIG